jgi:hypothetical protein
MVMIARVLMGMAFLVFGLNIFAHLIPAPPHAMSDKAMDFMGAMIKTGYMMSLVGATQVIVGILLLINRYVPLALTLIAPVIVNIIFFHSFLQLNSIGPGIVVALLEIYLAWSYRSYFAALLTSRSVPE